MRRLLLACLIAIASFPAAAVPVTYACKYTDYPSMSEFAAIDQIVIDREAKTFELRAASTMGTTHQVNWLFSDHGNGDDMLIWQTPSDQDRVVGVRAGLPFILERIDVVFGLSFADGLPFVYHQWLCLR